jgi:2'-5' RNA ligase/phosphoglycolate phosphatase-like HAD superfamily hydrolase
VNTLRTLSTIARLLTLGALFAALGTQARAETDPLPSWNDGPAKQAIVAFVKETTDQASAKFVPTAERIAVFDNDGTLWPENPIPFQLAYAVDTLKHMAAEKPELNDDPMVQAALAGDFAKLLEGPHHDGLLHIVALTHAGMTTDEFKAKVENWLSTARHPRYGKPYDQLTYQPMQEVLSYLRANGFKTFIVSGGGADFMRVWSERVYGIPPEQVVGSAGRANYELKPSGPVLVKTLDYLFVDDKEGKPVGIYEFIGRRPIAAFGNSDGDKAMLEYTTIDNPRPSLGMIIHHTDAEREYAYDTHPKSSGKLVEALRDAPRRSWIVVDMKSDWKRVFAFEPKGPSGVDDRLIAIDVLLEPDGKMLEEAANWNAQMREQSPEGFALDEQHSPHITLVQRFIAESDLGSVLAAVDRVKSAFDVANMQMTATGLYHIPSGKIGVAGIVIEPSDKLLALQQAVIEAVNPFARTGGDESAFVPDATGMPFDPLLFKYVDTFVPNQTGKKFNPHVTIGIAPLGWLEDLEKQHFSSFTFGTKGIATYQLGNFGTASKRLDSSE